MLTPRLTEELAATVAVATIAATLVNGALRPESTVFGRTILGGRDPDEMAITYDDGPNDNITHALLDVLAAHNARATFFMMGTYARQRPGIVRAVQSAGHLIGNHTMTHPWLAWQSAQTIREELTGCNNILEDLLGEPVRYFRPPHGARRPYVLKVARELGLKVVQWNVMGFDWEPIGPAKILRNIEGGIRRTRRKGIGANILLHDGGHKTLGVDRSDTVKVTSLLLDRIAATGCRTVTVDAWG